MLQINAGLTVEALTERYKVACDLRVEVDRTKIVACLKRWLARVSPKSSLSFRFAESSVDFLKIARAARAARDAWAARAARDAWDARAASWETSWVAITAIGARQRADVELFNTWLPVFEAFEAGCFAFWLTDDECVISERPTMVAVDDRRRLHRADGPAFSWLADVRDFYWHGVFVPEYVVLRPGEITAEKVNAEKNAEVRRVMIERFPGGQAAYLQAAGAMQVQQDDYGILYKKDLPDDEPLVMVKVVNSTAEPDGTFKDYFLRVPPTVTTAREAVAWTFGKTADEYAPAIQT